jgi:hypothetical protein
LEDGQGEPPVHGRGMVGSAVGLFLAPIVLAIVGAVVAGPGPGRQIVGAFCGLGIGLVGSILISRLFRFRSGEDA